MVIINKFKSIRVEIARPGASPAMKHRARLGPGLRRLTNLSVRPGPGLVPRFTLYQTLPDLGPARAMTKILHRNQFERTIVRKNNEKYPVGPIRIVTTFTKKSVLCQYWLAATDLSLLAQ